MAPVAEEDNSKHGGSRAAKRRMKKKSKQGGAAVSEETTPATVEESERKTSSLGKRAGGVNNSHIPKELLDISQEIVSHRKKKTKTENKDKRAAEVSRKGKKIIARYPQAQESFIIEESAMSADFESLTEVAHTVDNREHSRAVFEYLIGPMPAEEFYAFFWEKSPLVIKRKTKDYYDAWFSLEELRRIIESHGLEHGTDLDLTKYENGKRSTIVPSTTVDSDVLWSHVKKGCSIRMLRPQKFCDNLWHLLSLLEPEWGSMAGANTYFTPAGTQGFAPHYDDIEAFILQIHGKKKWRIYPALEENQVLPRFSSDNLDPKILPKPVLEVTLEPGDLLYFPRGFIHQAISTEDTDSLHVTISCSQSNSWTDLFELMVPQAVAAASAKCLELRKSLPRHYLEYIGAIHSDKDGDARRTKFIDNVQSLSNKIASEIMEMIDSAGDQMAVKFFQDRLPPVLTRVEEDYSCAGSPLPKITTKSSIRVVRHGLARLAVEDGKAVLYHVMDNSRDYHAHALRPLEFELDDAPAIELILESYPDFVCVGDLPLPTNDDQIELTTSLYKEGFIMLEPPLEEGDEESDPDERSSNQSSNEE